MQKIGFIFLVLMSFLVISEIGCQTKPQYKCEKLTGNIYELSVDAGGYPDKVIVSAGNDGLLIVDSGDRENGEALKEVLISFNKGMPKFIINSHSHIEHIGGNIAVGDSAVIIGHCKLRERYTNGLYLFLNVPEKYIPSITFNDSMSIFFNGEEIKLISFAGAHDNSDIIVWFTKSNVLCAGALCANHHLTTIDNETGDIRKYIPIVDKLIERIPDDILIVPGHSEDCGRPEMKQFRDMLVSTSNIIKSELQKGGSIQSMIEKDILSAWTSYENYATKDYWIQLWANAVKNHNSVEWNKPKPYWEIYEKINESGVEEAIKLYRKLKNEEKDKYYFDDRMLMYIGNLLWYVTNNQDAILFYKACIEEIPESETAYKCYFRLGNVYRSINHLIQAKECYEKYLQKFPFDKNVKKIIDGIK